MKLLTLAFSLFLLMDSIGNIPIFISILKEVPPKRQRIIIIRELLIALAIMICFNFVGEFLLNMLRISHSSVLIAGGIILFLISLKMIFPAGKDPEVSGPREKEPFIVPLAIPLVAGPAVLATIMLYSKQEPNNWEVVAAIGIAWLVSTIILVSASFLKTLLGWRGILACERLMGLLLTLIAVQMFLEGLSSYANDALAFLPHL